jgi:hypothetical protein
MRIALLALAVSGLVLRADAVDFARTSSFESVDAFVAAAAAFQPANNKTDLSTLFTVRELGQAEDPKTGRPIAATSVQSSVALWANDSHVFVFVVAAPPTDATRSVVAVLFLLCHTHGTWRISDSRRFAATGKYADVSAELTADAGTGYRLGGDDMRPVVTIKKSQGGRGYGYQVSASYSLVGSKIQRLELE